MVKERSIRMKQRRKDNPELMKKQGIRIKKRRDNPEIQKKQLKRRKENRKDNPELMENQSARIKKRKYGLLHEDWLKMWESQNGKCLICGKSSIKPSDLRIDHDHKTGKVRGLLCHNCNSGLGFFKDDPKIMIRAIEYLLRGKYANV